MPTCVFQFQKNFRELSPDTIKGIDRGRREWEGGELMHSRGGKAGEARVVEGRVGEGTDGKDGGEGMEERTWSGDVMITSPQC